MGRVHLGRHRLVRLRDRRCRGRTLSTGSRSRAAEELLAAAGNGERAGSDRLLAAATAHAQLAIAAALALPALLDDEGVPIVPSAVEEWGDAIL